jgi:hypothetical protein
MREPKSKRDTPLSREMRLSEPSRTVTPRDALNLAVEKWTGGQRVEMGSLADELGIGRATLFRWVGSRELLLGEVIWSVFEPTWKYALKQGKGTGAAYTADVVRKLIGLILKSEGLRIFIEQDAEYALRILTSKSSTVQTRIINEMSSTLRNLADSGQIRPALKIESLAYVMTRIVESCIYSDQITGRQPDIGSAADAIRILVAATPEAEPIPEPKTGIRNRR